MEKIYRRLPSPSNGRPLPLVELTKHYPVRDKPLYKQSLGLVFHASRRAGGEDHSVKVIPKFVLHRDPAAMKRFQNEEAALITTSHKHVTGLEKVFHDDNYIATDY